MGWEVRSEMGSALRQDLKSGRGLGNAEKMWDCDIREYNLTRGLGASISSESHCEK